MNIQATVKTLRRYTFIHKNTLQNLIDDLFFAYSSCKMNFMRWIMQTAVTKRGQTVIPASIRERYQIRAGDKIVWLDDGDSIKVVPVPADPIRALRGSGRGEQLVERLLSQRDQDRNRE
jgi:AbrB family looped-hinge helix DNA binding protein